MRRLALIRNERMMAATMLLPAIHAAVRSITTSAPPATRFHHPMRPNTPPRPMANITSRTSRTIPTILHRVSTTRMPTQGSRIPTSIPMLIAMPGSMREPEATSDPDCPLRATIPGPSNVSHLRMTWPVERPIWIMDGTDPVLVLHLKTGAICQSCATTRPAPPTHRPPRPRTVEMTR